MRCVRGRWALLALLVWPALAPAIGASEETLRTFEACWSTVRQRFYDRDLHGVDWDEVRRQFRPLADRAREGAELHAVLNGMLMQLGASHTTILEESVHESLMAELNNRRLPTAGLLLEVLDGRCFVRAQYEGGPGPECGLQRGDEIVAIGGKPVLRSGALVGAGYDPALGGDNLFFLRRTAPGWWDLEVREDAREPVLRRRLELRPYNGVDALRASTRRIERSGMLLGTFHVWYCSQGMMEAVDEALAGPLADCDALVVDLRGRGGLASTVRQLEQRVTRWREANGSIRPVIYVQDGRTRSAKELIAYRVQQRGTGTLVGERTEGAVLGAGFFPLPDGAWLELAVMDVPVDGVRLEGVGVEPHLPVESWLPYAEGMDLIFETGCHEAVLQVLGETAVESQPRLPIPRGS